MFGDRRGGSLQRLSRFYGLRRAFSSDCPGTFGDASLLAGDVARHGRVRIAISRLRSGRRERQVHREGGKCQRLTICTLIAYKCGMSTIRLSARARRDLVSLPAKDALRLLMRLIDHAAGEASSDVKPLHGDMTGYRLRWGDWRLLFDQVDDTLVVRRIGHRREIYE